MASQVAHIIYVKKYFDRLDAEGLYDLDRGEKLFVGNEKLDRDEFILGCIFPDIRRIDKNIKRKDTHLRFAPLNLDFRGLTSFEAGWKFHLYCDMRREDILNKQNFYSSNEIYIKEWAAKLLEDELVYNDYNNWEKVVNYFNNAPYVKTDLNISQNTFHLWYAMVAKYLEKKPNDKSMRIFLVKQKLDDTNLQELIKFVRNFRKDKKAIEILKKIQDEIL